MSTYVHIYVYVCILVLQYVAVCCSECLVSGWFDGKILSRYVHICVYVCVPVLQRVAACCSVLQYDAVCCIVLQCVAVCRSVSDGKICAWCIRECIYNHVNVENSLNRT